MSSDNITHLAWIDLETTGLDHYRDPIIEIALIITDLNLDVPVPGYQPFVTAVNPGPGLLDARLEATPWAKETHSQNGLLEQISNGDCMETSEAERFMLAHLVTYGADQKRTALAGSGVANFDKPVLERQMPAVFQFFPYFSLDMGSVRRFIKHVVNKPELIPDQPQTHRAFDDVRYSLHCALMWRDFMRSYV